MAKRKQQKTSKAKRAPKKEPRAKLVDMGQRELAKLKKKAAKLDELIKQAVASPFDQITAEALQHSTAATRRGRWKETFLKALSVTGNVTAAARVAAVDRVTVYEHKKTDKKFAEAWDGALQQAVELMEMEAHRRAFSGTVRPVFQGGGLAGEVREYSDTLAIFLLKAHRPDKYRERIGVKNENPLPTAQPDAAARSAAIAHLLGEIESEAAGGPAGPGGEGAAGAGAAGSASD